MADLPHFDSKGQARMVNVGAKPATDRTAIVTGIITMLPATADLIRERKLEKGDVLQIARLAGIMAAKRTDDLIPLCHPIPLNSVDVEFKFPQKNQLQVVAEVSAHHRTGVEMEAMTAASVALLTVYDMCKSVDRAMIVGPVQLEEKSGGKSGHFLRDKSNQEDQDG